jgi:hypothetical protein
VNEAIVRARRSCVGKGVYHQGEVFMLRFPRIIAVAAVVAAFATVAYAGEREVKLLEPVTTGQFEVRNADRGMSKRVKVYFGQEKVATLSFSRGEETGFCCTAESCKPVEVKAKCESPESLKLACKGGVCSVEKAEK